MGISLVEAPPHIGPVTQKQPKVEDSIFQEAKKLQDLSPNLHNGTSLALLKRPREIPATHTQASLGEASTKK